MENSYSQFKVIFFDVLKCDSTYNWEKKLLIIVNVLKFLHMSLNHFNVHYVTIT